MALQISPECLQCHINRSIDTAKKQNRDEETLLAFTRELLKLLVDSPEDITSPGLGPDTSALFQKYYQLDPDRYREEKIFSNQFVMERLDSIREQIHASENPLMTAVKFAIMGNYIDFSALYGKVSFQQLDDLLASAPEMVLDLDCFQQLETELSAARTLLYLTDNAGEICFDRLLAEEIARQFPNLSITFCVRGLPVNNDATREDAEATGIPFPVIDNGDNVGGTDLSRINNQAREAMDRADVIIAKGMGNIETLLGSGYPIFYLFLIKCQRFVTYFEKPMFTPMLLRESKE